jgi:AcrR family transcriptional regulator
MVTRRDNPYWRTKHERILEAAFEEFSKNGYDTASMEKIAEAAGVSKVTVYNHFMTKDQLFVECCEYFFDFIFRPFEFDPTCQLVDGVFSLNLFIERFVKFLLDPTILAMRSLMRSEHHRMVALGVSRTESDFSAVQLVAMLARELPVEEGRRLAIAEMILSLMQVKCQNYADKPLLPAAVDGFDSAVLSISHAVSQVVDRSGILV